ncbi:hypothetical protein Tco_0198820 [Tanacetum coccineum]
MRLVTHDLEGCEFENTYNNNKSLSEIQLEHEKEDELVVVVVKVEIEDGILEEMEVSLFGKKVMILEWMSCAFILVLLAFLVFKRSSDGDLSKTLVVRVKIIGRREDTLNRFKVRGFGSLLEDASGEWFWDPLGSGHKGRH